MDTQVRCPKCKSDQITANKKGFSGGKAVAGAVVAGPLGIAAGTLGSNKVKITCLSCGHTFNPGDKPVKKQQPLSAIGGGMVIVFSLISLFLMLKLFGFI